MNILSLNGSSAAQDFLKNLFANEFPNYEFFPAFGIFEANELIKERPFEVLILSLNMDDSGLTASDQQKTMYGLLTGWIWWQSNRPNFQRYFPNKLIIFSKYLKDFEKNIPLAERSFCKLVENLCYQKTKKDEDLMTQKFLAILTGKL